MTIAGLPLHPLVVHMAVILVPIAALALLGTAWHPGWRRQHGLLIALLAAAGAAGAFLAAQTGEALEETIRAAARQSGTRVRFGDHPSQGNTAEMFALLLAVCAAAVCGLEWWSQRRGITPAPWMWRMLYSVSALVSIGAVGTMVIAGDSGARLVWEQIGTFVGQR